MPLIISISWAISFFFIGCTRISAISLFWIRIHSPCQYIFTFLYILSPVAAVIILTSLLFLPYLNKRYRLLLSGIPPSVYITLALTGIRYCTIIPWKLIHDPWQPGSNLDELWPWFSLIVYSKHVLSSTVCFPVHSSSHLPSFPHHPRIISEFKIFFAESLQDKDRKTIYMEKYENLRYSKLS